VIDIGPVGFRKIRLCETDGKVGQALFVRADDFTLLAEPPAPVLAPALGARDMTGLVLLLAFIGGRA
jgi:hypothetical protein